MAIALMAAVSLGLVACDPDTAVVGSFTTPTPVVHAQRAGAIAIAHGAAFAVQAWMSHEEVEGSSALDVTRVRADDPAVLEVRPTSHAYSDGYDDSPNGLSWVLVGTLPGSTTLRLYRDDDEVGAVAVDIVEQVQ
jgi:hypothetical protein